SCLALGAVVRVDECGDGRVVERRTIGQPEDGAGSARPGADVGLGVELPDVDAGRGQRVGEARIVDLYPFYPLAESAPRQDQREQSEATARALDREGGE